MGAQEDADVSSPFETRWSWKEGAASGFVATVIMGVFITLMNLETLRESIAGLYGFEGNLVIGWMAHLGHGTLFGLIFAAVMADPGLYKVTDWFSKTVAAGIVYGVILSVAGAGIIMPIWLEAAGFSDPPSMPFVTVPSLVWHLIYGVVLGSLFYALKNM